jgi:hypothetical protein
MATAIAPSFILELQDDDITKAAEESGYSADQIDMLLSCLRDLEANLLADSINDCIGMVLDKSETLSEEELAAVNQCFTFARTLAKISK